MKLPYKQVLAALVGVVAMAGCEPAPAPGMDTPVAAAEEKKAPGMVAAMLAVFPEADPATGDVPVTVTDNIMPTVERPMVLIREPEKGLAYLVTAQEQADGCHSCAPPLSVFYLREDADKLTLVSSHRDVLKSGGWGDAGDIAPITFADGALGFTDDSGFTAQGCTSSFANVFRFEDAGPVNVLKFAPLAKEYEEIAVGGSFITPPAGADFAVHYTGKGSAGPVDATVVWTMQGGELVQTSGEIPADPANGC